MSGINDFNIKAFQPLDAGIHVQFTIDYFVLKRLTGVRQQVAAEQLAVFGQEGGEHGREVEALQSSTKYLVAPIGELGQDPEDGPLLQQEEEG